MRRLQDLEIARLLEPLEPCVADVGARGGIDRDLIEIAWACKAYGFEPNPEEAERLRTAEVGAWKRIEILPFALGGRTGPGTLYLPEGEQGASLLRHNEAMVERFGFENLHVTRRTIPVETITLDDLHSSGRLPGVDYLKIDVEGAELAILEAGGTVLSGCSALKIECSFLEQRIGQPLVWEVVAHLLAAGFELMDIRDIHFWRRRPLPTHPFRTSFRMPYSRGQAAQCDLVLLRRPDAVSGRRNAAMLAVIAAALGYFDFSVSLLRGSAGLDAFIRDEFGVQIERALCDWSALAGRGTAARELRSQLRGLVPRLRSALGLLPYSNPRRSY